MIYKMLYFNKKPTVQFDDNVTEIIYEIPSDCSLKRFNKNDYILNRNIDFYYPIIIPRNRYKSNYRGIGRYSFNNSNVYIYNYEQQRLPLRAAERITIYNYDNNNDDDNDDNKCWIINKFKNYCKKICNIHLFSSNIPLMKTDIYHKYF